MTEHSQQLGDVVRRQIQQSFAPDPWRLWNHPEDGLTPPPPAPPTGKGQAK